MCSGLCSLVNVSAAAIVVLVSITVWGDVQHLTRLSPTTSSAGAGVLVVDQLEQLLGPADDNTTTTTTARTLYFIVGPQATAPETHRYSATGWIQHLLCTNYNRTDSILRQDSIVFLGTCPASNLHSSDASAKTLSRHFLQDDSTSFFKLPPEQDHFEFSDYFDNHQTEFESVGLLTRMRNGELGLTGSSKQRPRLTTTLKRKLATARELGQDVLILFEGASSWTSPQIEALAAFLKQQQEWKVQILVNYQPHYQWLPWLVANHNSQTRLATAIYKASVGHAAQWVYQAFLAAGFANTQLIPIHRLHDYVMESVSQKMQQDSLNHPILDSRAGYRVWEFLACQVMKATHMCQYLQSGQLEDELKEDSTVPRVSIGGKTYPTYLAKYVHIAEEGLKLGLLKENDLEWVARQIRAWQSKQSDDAFFYWTCPSNVFLAKFQSASNELERRLFMEYKNSAYYKHHVFKKAGTTVHKYNQIQWEDWHHQGYTTMQKQTKEFCHVNPRLTVKDKLENWTQFFKSFKKEAAVTTGSDRSHQEYAATTGSSTQKKNHKEDSGSAKVINDGASNKAAAGDSSTSTTSRGKEAMGKEAINDGTKTKAPDPAEESPPKPPKQATSTSSASPLAKTNCLWYKDGARQSWGDQLKFTQLLNKAEQDMHTIFANRSVLVLGGSTSRDLAADFLQMTLDPTSRQEVKEAWGNEQGHAMFPALGKHETEFANMYKPELMDPLLDARWKFTHLLPKNEQDKAVGCADCTSGYTNIDYRAKLSRGAGIKTTFEFSWKPEIFAQADGLALDQRYCKRHYDVVIIAKGLHDAHFKDAIELTREAMNKRFQQLVKHLQCFSSKKTLVIVRTPYTSTCRVKGEPQALELASQILREEITLPSNIVLLDGYLLTAAKGHPTTIDPHHYDSTIARTVWRLSALATQSYFGGKKSNRDALLAGAWQHCGLTTSSATG